MNAAAINMSRVSNGLIASQLKSAEALSNEGLHFFNQIFRLNWSTARESLDIHLSCFGKILHENNLDRSNEIIVDHIKLVPKHVTGYMCDIAELGKKNNERVRRLADVAVAETVEDISDLVEGVVRTAAGGSEHPVEILRANMAIFEAACKKVSSANKAVSDNFYNHLQYYVDELSPRKFEGSVGGVAPSPSQDGIDSQAETEGGGIE